MLLCPEADWSGRLRGLLFGHHIPAAQPRNCTTQNTSLIHCGARRSWRRTVVCQRGKPPSNSLYCVNRENRNCLAPRRHRSAERQTAACQKLHFTLTHCFLIQDLRVLCYTHWRGKTGTMHVYCYQLPASASIAMCSSRHTLSQRHSVGMTKSMNNEIRRTTRTKQEIPKRDVWRRNVYLEGLLRGDTPMDRAER